MTDDTTLDDLRMKHDRNQQQRLAWIDQWAAFVASGEDDNRWGEQLNALIDAQIESARNATRSPSDDRSTERPSDSTETL